MLNTTFFIVGQKNLRNILGKYYIGIYVYIANIQVDLNEFWFIPYTYYIDVNVYIANT